VAVPEEPPYLVLGFLVEMPEEEANASGQGLSVRGVPGVEEGGGGEAAPAEGGRWGGRGSRVVWGGPLRGWRRGSASEGVAVNLLRIDVLSSLNL